MTMTKLFIASAFLAAATASSVDQSSAHLQQFDHVEFFDSGLASSSLSVEKRQYNNGAFDYNSASNIINFYRDTFSYYDNTLNGFYQTASNNPNLENLHTLMAVSTTEINNSINNFYGSAYPYSQDLQNYIASNLFQNLYRTVERSAELISNHLNTIPTGNAIQSEYVAALNKISSFSGTIGVGGSSVSQSSQRISNYFNRGY